VSRRAVRAAQPRIREVVDLLASIVAQIHILALNAAVERAGAGEAGQRIGGWRSR
jgi:methyl-accepting chemotaxis protein